MKDIPFAERAGVAASYGNVRLRRLIRSGRTPYMPMVLALALVSSCGGKESAYHETSVPWALGGQQLVADLHMHTRFSDGDLEPDTLVRKAYAAGCQALAITDHSDVQVKGGTAAYVNTLRDLRKAFPQHVLIAGLEWNVPPKASGTHVGVLFDTSAEQYMIGFKARFENSAATLAEAFGWLSQQTQEPTQIAFIYNHPSRMGVPDAQVAAQWANWRQFSARAIGFEGGPGHQNSNPNGAYKTMPTVERWDGTITRIGGAWDQLLDRGKNPWGAIASSDYHRSETDYTPCAFSRTVLSVPEATPAGVLKALHAGSFWGAHGRFIDYLLFTANAPGLQIPAAPGETIRVAKGTPLRVRIAVERYAPAGGTDLTAELIGNCKSGKPEALAVLKIAAKQTEAETVIPAATAGADGISCYIRARVRGQNEKGEPALAHTNPIRARFAAARRD